MGHKFAYAIVSEDLVIGVQILAAPYFFTMLTAILRAYTYDIRRIAAMEKYFTAQILHHPALAGMTKLYHPGDMDDKRISESITPVCRMAVPTHEGIGIIANFQDRGTLDRFLEGPTGFRAFVDRNPGHYQLIIADIEPIKVEEYGPTGRHQ